MTGERLTVVMLNWARPANVIRFAARYRAMPFVETVNIVNCRPDTAVHPPDCGTVDLHEDPGLNIRFAIGGIARTRGVMLVDDDIELYEDAIWTLFATWQDEVRRLVGIFGRRPAASGVYTPATYNGKVEILLTRVVIGDRTLMGKALAAAQTAAIEIPGEPFGNGEDIVLSYAALKEYGRRNLAMKLPYRNVDYDDANAISVRNLRHEAHRTKVVRWCRANLCDDTKMPM